MKEYKECHTFLQECLQQLCCKNTMSERISSLGLALNQMTTAHIPGVLRSDYVRIQESIKNLLHRYETENDVSVVTEALYCKFVEALMAFLMKLNEWLTLEEYLCSISSWTI